MEGAWKYSPAAAVPVRTKIPEPMMAPMLSAVSDQGPSVLLSRVSGCSESEISLSIDLQQNAWVSEVRRTTSADSVVDSDKSRCLLTAGVGHGRLPMPGTACGPSWRLALRLAAYHLLHLPLFRSSRVFAWLLRLLGFDLLARGALDFLAFYFFQLLCVCHDYGECPLLVRENSPKLRLCPGVLLQANVRKAKNGRWIPSIPRHRYTTLAHLHSSG